MSRFATTRELCCGSIQDIITKVFMWFKKKSENDRPIATTKLLGVQITINLIAVSECDEKKAHCEISKNILPPQPKAELDLPVLCLFRDMGRVEKQHLFLFVSAQIRKV